MEKEVSVKKDSSTRLETHLKTIVSEGQDKWRLKGCSTVGVSSIAWVNTACWFCKVVKIMTYKSSFQW